MSVASKQDSIAGRIAASICDEHGNPVFSSPLDITHGPLDPVELEKPRKHQAPRLSRWRTVRRPAVCHPRGERPGKDEELTELDEIWHELVLSGIGGSTIAQAKT